MIIEENVRTVTGMVGKALEYDVEVWRLDFPKDALATAPGYEVLGTLSPPSLGYWNDGRCPARTDFHLLTRRALGTFWIACPSHRNER